MDFNSLDAQRESCEAYVASQRAEGWILLQDRYDDGGISGGSLDRPALRRLLADIERGLVDVVIVYKIDRLSRALVDFVKLVEIFDRNEVSFIAVTQNFATTTPMGRLTLHILMSFGQYEREAIGERIRDKFAASRARGMWMGGHPPLGYDVRDRKLMLNQGEADTVRRIFAGFAELGSGTQLVRHLRESGVTTKRGRSFTRGDLYKLINNRLYLGEVVHKGRAFPGAHTAILTQAQWDAAHDILRESPRVRANRSRNRTPALLAGLVFGSDGRAMSPTHTRKPGGRLYRYYVSQSVLRGGAGDGPAVSRLPAEQIEAAVIGHVRALLRQPEVVVGTWRAARAQAPNLTEAATGEALAQLEPLWDALFPAEQARIIRLLVERVDVGPDGADIRLRTEGLASLMRDLSVRHSDAARVAA
jgi:DNA invertase Pin-like site-specific DNA recombinase